VAAQHKEALINNVLLLDSTIATDIAKSVTGGSNQVLGSQWILQHWTTRMVPRWQRHVKKGLDPDPDVMVRGSVDEMRGCRDCSTFPCMTDEG
jgi:hypothetical protein